MTFQEVGNDFGFETSEAEGERCRVMNAASFNVADYLKEVPRDVVEGIARTFFSRIHAGEELDCPECARDS